MKYLILLGLVSMGVSSIVITPQGICACTQLSNIQDCSRLPGCVWQSQQCQPNDCTNIKVQSDCLKASRYCYWNLDGQTCQTFTGCQSIKITSYKECAQSNVQCSSFNGQGCQQLDTITDTCSQYQEAYCADNVGIDGVCFWESSCQAITQCNQKQKCNDDGIACQLVDGQCIEITSCNDFEDQQSCKYVLNSSTLILCEWNSNQCIEAQNTHYLNSDNCLLATGYNYRWLATSNSDKGICATCSIQPIKVSGQCECQQYILQSDCNLNYCAWIDQVCTPLTCAQIQSQSVCISQKNCYWDYSNTGSCQQFDTCSDLSGSSLICSSQNIYCLASNGYQCQDSSQLSVCTSNNEGCVNWIGSDGICKWTNGLCLPIQSCYQITDAVYCNNHFCEWNAQDQLCQPQTCSSYNSNPEKCLYIRIGNEYQFCKYNAETQQCEDSAIGNAQNCSISGSYRWSNTSTRLGMCLPCSQVRLQTNSSCFCYQFTLQQECNDSGYCQFIGGACKQKQCSSFNQITCASMQQCYWSNGCNNFSGCNQLIANNQLECMGQNMQCKGYVDGKCSVSVSLTCNQMDNCNNSIGSDGICFIKDGQCLGLTSCFQAPQNICEKYETACYWNSKQCQPQQCVNFKTQKSCVFIQVSPQSSQIIPCVWNSSTNLCQNAQDAELTSQTCSTNTKNTYRWVSIDSSNGYCIKCQQQVSIYGSCPCTYLLTQHDCQQAYQCYWSNNICQQYNCYQIQFQGVCISQQQCAWVDNQCINYNGECSSLQGSNKQQCLNQQLQCNGSNGDTCIQTIERCKSNKTLTGCVNMRGIDGFCYWNHQHLVCLPITECRQLPEYACSQQLLACYYSNNQCQELTCEQQYLLTGYCKYVVQISTQNMIQTCQLINDECINAHNFNSLNEEQCFANSDHTSRWTPLKNNKGICEKCILNLIPINNRQKCQCHQFMTEYDCLNSKCSWQNEECQSQDCTQIYDQSQCISTYGCAWSNTQCDVFQSCSIANGYNLSGCLAYSLICRGYNGTSCTQEPIQTCSQFNQQDCNNNIGTDGLCQFSQNSCDPINQCEQIKNVNVCSTYTNACQWINGQCTTFTCQSITNVMDCTYVVKSFQTGDIQLCKWNQDTCQDLKVFKVGTASNCAQSTGFTYRWIPTKWNNLGYCSKCVLDVHSLIPGQCACNQLYSEAECSQNPECIWNNQTCSTKECSQIEFEDQCIINFRCQWDFKDQECEEFQNCSELESQNSLECKKYSINCPNSQEFCSNGSIQFPIVASNICFWKNQMYGFCSEITSFQICSQCQYQCIWQTDSNNISSCQQTSCGNFDQNNCKFYFSDVGIPSTLTTIYCTWTDNQCEYSTLQSQLQNQDQSTCYQNSSYLYRWASLNQTYSTCLSCSRFNQSYLSYDYQQQMNNIGVCKCTQLPQQDCVLLYPVCTYTDNKCIQTTTCEQQNNQNCPLIKECIWLDGSCVQFKSCSQIISATSPLQCVAASINCQGFNGSTCFEIQNCYSFADNQTCQAYNYQVAAVSGLCYWNQIFCQPITMCSNIQDRQLCNLQTNRCFWNGQACQNAGCGQFQNEISCNFYYPYYLSDFQQQCVWSYQQCYSLGSGSSCLITYNYRYYDNANNQCEFCEMSYFLTVIQLYFLLTIV